MSDGWECKKCVARPFHRTTMWQQSTQYYCPLESPLGSAMVFWGAHGCIANTKRVDLWHVWPLLAGCQPHKANLTKQGGVLSLPYLKTIDIKGGFSHLKEPSLVHDMHHCLTQCIEYYRQFPSNPTHLQYNTILASSWVIPYIYNIKPSLDWWSLAANDFSTL